MRDSIFINGVFDSVLEEILTSQQSKPDRVHYLQPYSSSRIKLLAKNRPDQLNPVPLYISTTKSLDKICYTAEVIGWENKEEISEERLFELNQHINRFQKGEGEIYLKTDDGKKCVNLISIRNLIKLPNEISVSNLVKISDEKPLKPRTQAGGWAYVKEIPEWINIPGSAIQEQLEEDLYKSVIESSKLSDQERRKRLQNAPKKPEQIQVISKAFKRNPHVIVEVLKRANGKCERCKKDAPFIRAKDGSPYLEIHHWEPLSDGGNDTIDNAGALCPNCHREVHFGQ